MRSCVAAVVLAAGASTRMAPRNKLLLSDRFGETMVGRVVLACVSSAASLVVVVTGHAEAEVRQAVQAATADGAVRFVYAADHAHGQSCSLRAGLAALPQQTDAAVICLADMPLVTSGIIDRLIMAYDAAAGGRIVVPVHAGRRGNPVLWDRQLFSAMASVSGDMGARGLFAAHAASLVQLEVEDDAVLRDFDTPESYAAGF